MDIDRKVFKTVMVLSVVSLPLAYLLAAFTLMKIWLWHIAMPLDVAPLSLHGAFGIVLVISYLTNNYQVSNVMLNSEQQVRAAAATLAVQFISPIVTLLIGWVVYQLF